MIARACDEGCTWSFAFAPCAACWRGRSPEDVVELLSLHHIMRFYVDNAFFRGDTGILPDEEVSPKGFEAACFQLMQLHWLGPRASNLCRS